MALQKIQGENQVAGIVPDAAAVKGITIGATPPTTGQVLTATSPTTASWQTGGVGSLVNAMYWVGGFGGKSNSSDGIQYSRDNDSIGTDGTNMFIVGLSELFNNLNILRIDGDLVAGNILSVTIDGATPVTQVYVTSSDNTLELFAAKIATEVGIEAYAWPPIPYREMHLYSADRNITNTIDDFSITGAGAPTPTTEENFYPLSEIVVLKPADFTSVYKYPAPFSAYDRPITMPRNIADEAGVPQRWCKIDIGPYEDGYYMYTVLTNDVIVKIDAAVDIGDPSLHGTVLASKDLTVSGPYEIGPLYARQSIATDGTDLYIPLMDDTIIKVSGWDLSVIWQSAVFANGLCGSIAHGGGFLWAGGPGDGNGDLYKIDPSDGSILATTDFPNRDTNDGPKAQFLTYDSANGKLWAGATSIEAVYRIDPVSGFEFAIDGVYDKSSIAPQYIIDDITNDGADLFVLLRLYNGTTNIGAAIDRYGLTNGDFRYRMIYDTTPTVPKENTKSSLTIHSITYSARMVGSDGAKINVLYTDGAATAEATGTIQDIDYTSKLLGVGGNDTSIAYTTGGTQGAEGVTVVGQAITIQIQSGFSTAADIMTAISNDSDANDLVSTASANPTNAQTAPAGPTSLTGGQSYVVVVRTGDSFSIQIRDNVTIATEIVDAVAALSAGSDFPKLDAVTTAGAEEQLVSWADVVKHLDAPMGGIFGQRFVHIENEIFVIRGKHILRIVKAL